MMKFLLMFLLPSIVFAQVYPPGDVNGNGHVTGADSLLINQVQVGLRNTNDPIFAASGYSNGDVNQNGFVSGGDSLLINQVMVGARAYVITKSMPSFRSNQPCIFALSPDTIFVGAEGGSGTIEVIAIPPPPTVVHVYGMGFRTNEVPSVTIGPPVNLSATNVVVLGQEVIRSYFPAGGGAGTGTVFVTFSSTNGAISFARFINQ